MLYICCINFTQMFLLYCLANQTILELHGVHIHFSLCPPFQILLNSVIVLNSVISQHKLDTTIFFIFFFIYIMIICQTQSKNPLCKIQITVNRNFNLRCVMNFFLLAGNISNSGYPVLWQLKRSWSHYQLHCQPFFSNEQGVNFKFEFCNSIEENLMRLCYVLLILLPFMYISRDRKCY